MEGNAHRSRRTNGVRAGAWRGDPWGDLVNQNEPLQKYVRARRINSFLFCSHHTKIANIIACNPEKICFPSIARSSNG